MYTHITHIYIHTHTHTTHTHIYIYIYIYVCNCNVLRCKCLTWKTYIVFNYLINLLFNFVDGGGHRISDFFVDVTNY